MYSIDQRRAISKRIAKPSDIPVYRRLLQVAGNPYASTINADEKKLAVILVSALLTNMSEEEILTATSRPSAAKETATVTTSAPAAAPAVKKNARKSRNTRTSTGKIWTILSSGLRTLSTRMQSIWAAGCAKLKSACTNRKRTPAS